MPCYNKEHTYYLHIVKPYESFFSHYPKMCCYTDLLRLLKFFLPYIVIFAQMGKWSDGQRCW